jgi:drug/metabolite transporter (DMT)-like permease
MTMAINPRMGGREWGLLILLSLLWGGAFFCVKVSVGEIPPLALVLPRAGLAALALIAILPLLGERLPRGIAPWRALIVMGVLNNAIPFALLNWGQTHVASGLAAMLNATTPLFSAAIAQLAGQERLTPARIAGLSLGVAGLAVMLAPDPDAGSESLWAELACLGAALSYGIAGVFGRRHLRGLPPLAAAAGQLIASTTIMLPVVLVCVPQAWSLRPGAGVIAAVIALALFGTALAYAIYFRILATAGATNLLLVTVLIPVSAALLGGLFLGERLAARDFLGMGVIALGLATIDGRPLAALRRAVAG